MHYNRLLLLLLLILLSLRLLLLLWVVLAEFICANNMSLLFQIDLGLLQLNLKKNSHTLNHRRPRPNQNSIQSLPTPTHSKFPTKDLQTETMNYSTPTAKNTCNAKSMLSLALPTSRKYKIVFVIITFLPFYELHGCYTHQS